MDWVVLRSARHLAQRLLAQPVEQFITVRRVQDVIKRIVLAPPLFNPLGDHQQIEVVVSQHGNRRRTERFDQAQSFQRLRAAIDEVADEPQAVLCQIETARVKQDPE